VGPGEAGAWETNGEFSRVIAAGSVAGRRSSRRRRRRRRRPRRGRRR